MLCSYTNLLKREMSYKTEDYPASKHPTAGQRSIPHVVEWLELDATLLHRGLADKLTAISNNYHQE